MVLDWLEKCMISSVGLNRGLDLLLWLLFWEMVNIDVEMICFVDVEDDDKLFFSLMEDFMWFNDGLDDEDDMLLVSVFYGGVDDEDDVLLVSVFYIEELFVKSIDGVD